VKFWFKSLEKEINAAVRLQVSSGIQAKVNLMRQTPTIYSEDVYTPSTSAERRIVTPLYTLIDSRQTEPTFRTNKPRETGGNFDIKARKRNLPPLKDANVLVLK
jgi:hypothetical protein